MRIATESHPAPPRQRWVFDALVIVGIVIGWQWLLYAPVMSEMPVGDDTFRDTAYVHNAMEGYVWQDPSMRGFEWWYMPGSAVFFAGVCKLTGWLPLEAYTYSILWLNVWLAILFYWLVRVYTDQATGLCALLAGSVGCLWWQTHCSMPMPSTHGVILTLLSFIVWRPAFTRGGVWLFVCGIVLAATTWHHLICGIVACGAIGFHALYWLRSSGNHAGRTVFRRALITGAICGVLVSPAAWHLLSMPWNNYAHYSIASSALEVDFAFHARTPLYVVMLLIGGIVVYRQRRHEIWWAFGVITIGLIGQITGLIRHAGVTWMPSVLPHEFQWHTLTGFSALAGVGVVVSARWCARRLGKTPSRAGMAVAASCILLATASPDGLNPLRRYAAFWIPSRCPDEVQPMVDWIKSNTHINDVILANYIPAYYDVAARTGRKLVLMPEARANLAAMVTERRRDLSRMKTTRAPDVWWRLAVEKHDARYVYLTSYDLKYRNRLLAWDVVEPVLRSPEGTRHILRIKRDD